MKQESSSPTFTGTQINYYFICKRKLWYFSKDLSMEHNSDNVSIGKQIHEKSYKREKKEIMIDNRIAVDFIGNKGVVNEVKKSNSIEEAHRFQVLYYIYYLNQKGVKNIKGVIRYPKLRDKVKVRLTEESKSELVDVLKEIEEILSREKPPPIAKNRSFCKKCSYYELCWI